MFTPNLFYLTPSLIHEVLFLMFVHHPIFYKQVSVLSYNKMLFIDGKTRYFYKNLDVKHDEAVIYDI